MAPGVPPSPGSCLGMIQGLLGVHGVPSSLMPHLEIPGIPGLPPFQTPPLSRLPGPPAPGSPLSALPTLEVPGVPLLCSPRGPQDQCPPPAHTGQWPHGPPKIPEGLSFGVLQDPNRHTEKNLPGTPDDIWGSIQQSASSKHTPIKKPSQGPPDRFGTSFPSTLPCRM